MIADARSLVLALVGVPAVVGFGKLPGLGVETVSTRRKHSFKPNITAFKYLNATVNGQWVIYDPCSNLMGGKKEHDAAFGELNFITNNSWCGVMDKTLCGDPRDGNGTTFRVGAEVFTTKYGKARYYDICLWDENFKSRRYPQGKCRATGWSYTCPTKHDGQEGCPAPQAHKDVERRSSTEDGPVRMSTRKESCSLKAKPSKLHLTPEGTPAEYHYVETCDHKLIRVLSPSPPPPSPPQRRRLDSRPQCPNGVIPDKVKNGNSYCCTGTIEKLLDEFYTEEVRGSRLNYKETCTYDGTNDECVCKTSKNDEGGEDPCPFIEPFAWWA